MKYSASLRLFLFLALSATSGAQAALLLPDSNADSPHADRVMLFDGKLNFWAAGLYGFCNGQKVVFENAGAVTIDGFVAPQSVSVRGSGNTIWNGSGQLAGETALIKEGSGTLVMNAFNAYSGGTLIKEGCVTAGGAASFGTGAIELSGGVLNSAGYEIANEILLSGGILVGATATSNQLIFNEHYTVTQEISARSIQLRDGVRLRVEAGGSLSSAEELKLSGMRSLDLSAGGSFKGNLLVEDGGILKLAADGSTAIPTGSVWHLNSSAVSGNLSTAPLRAAGRTATAGSTLRISGSSRISGALTLSGGTLLLSCPTDSLHAETLVLSAPTALRMETAPAMGSSQTFLTFDRLLSGSVTDYYEFFGVDKEQYELSVSAQAISITAAERKPAATPPQNTQPSLSPEPPATSPAPVIPEAGEQEPGTPGGAEDTAPDTDAPHHNKETEPEYSGNSSSAESAAALSHAGIQSAWGERFATHAFMTAVHDNSRNTQSATWAAFYGGFAETEASGGLPGGETTAEGLAIGAEAQLTESTQLGLALGGAIGSITGESFGELDRLSLHAAAYIGHCFTEPESSRRLKLYGAIGVGRAETDPGTYSGLESWHHRSFFAHTRLSQSINISQNLIWELYGAAEYYRSGAADAGDASVSGITELSGSIGSGIVLVGREVILYAEAEMTGDMLRDTPTARCSGNEYRAAEPERCGFSLRCGVQLTPEDTRRSIRLHYAYESRSNSAAHVLNAGFSGVF